jgi:hypothetical protein
MNAAISVLLRPVDLTQPVMTKRPSPEDARVSRLCQRDGIVADLNPPPCNKRPLPPLDQLLLNHGQLGCDLNFLFGRPSTSIYKLCRNRPEVLSHGRA